MVQATILTWKDLLLRYKDRQQLKVTKYIDVDKTYQFVN